MFDSTELTWEAHGLKIYAPHPRLPAKITSIFTTVLYAGKRMKFNFSLLLSAGFVFGSLMPHASYAIAPISGADTLCGVSATLYTDATPGGSWSCSGMAGASIDAVSGVLTVGTSMGVASITYTVGGGFVTKSVAASPAPSLAGMHDMTLSGGGTYCAGSAGLMVIVPHADTGWLYIAIWGTDTISAWGTGDSLSFGYITGIPGGEVLLLLRAVNKYSGCSSSDAYYKVFTIDEIPNPAPILGDTAPICTENALQLSDSVSGGAWTSSNPAVATVTSTGLVFGLSAGTANITYSLSPDCPVTVTVSPCGATLYTPVPNAAQLNIFPNPAFDVITISGLQSPVSYTIVNTTGAPVQSGNLPAGDSRVPVYTIPAGMYFLKVGDDSGGNIVRKIAILH
jgi:hypothetical protein